MLLAALCLALLGAAAKATIPLAEPYAHDFSCGVENDDDDTSGHPSYCRTLYVDEDSDAVYVGCMDHLYRLDATNVSRSDCQRNAMHLPPSNVANCVSRGKSEEFHCRNHIRVIQPIRDGKGRLYICGTNAHSPKDYVVYSNLTEISRHEFFPGIGDGIAKCPFDPEDNSTALWVESGNPGGHPAIYSGTNAEFTKADTVIFRGDIFDMSTGKREYSFKRTIKYDSHMLDKPDFVGSFDVGNYVYFFFRETAVEFMNCGKTVYSRVARVCKKDVGGKNILSQNWATYLKARLNCSIPGEFPFFFNEIQDVFKSVEDDSIFHAVFSTGSGGLPGSAICSFSLADIESTFDESKFKEQATSTSMWLPVPSAKVPEPRPGKCVDDSRELPDTVLNFIRKHPLMDGDVPHDNSAPAFYQRDVVFTKLVVDHVSVGRYGREGVVSVFFAGTENGMLYKVSRWRDADGRFQSRLLDVMDVTAPHPVRAIAISRKHKSLYVSSDYVVRQLALDVCAARYSSCIQCIRDPYCGWDREAGACRGGQQTLPLLQNPYGDATGICEATAPKKKVEANFGQVLHLVCGLSLPMPGDVTWHFTDVTSGATRPIRFDASPDKYVATLNGGLIIFGMKERDSGEYACHLGHEMVSQYVVSVNAHRCKAPNNTAEYLKAHSDWCQEVQKYKHALKTWEKRQSGNKCAPKDGLGLLGQNQVFGASPLV